MKATIKYHSVPEFISQDFGLNAFSVFNIISEGKGKLLFVQKTETGKYTLIDNLEEGHVELVQQEIDFAGIDYTLFLSSILEKISSENESYFLEVISNAIYNVLSGKSFGSVTAKDILAVLSSSKDVVVYSGIGNGENRVEEAFLSALSAEEAATINKDELLLTIDYPSSKSYTIDEHLNLILNLQNKIGLKRKLKYSKNANNLLGNHLGVSFITTVNRMKSVA